MNNIDRYIKMNFSFIKGELIGLFCCTLFASAGIFMPSLAIMVLILLVVMIVLVVRVYTKVYSKTLFEEGAVLYQSLPFSTNEIVVAKTFVVTVATLISMIGLMGGVTIGLAVLTAVVQEPEMIMESLELINTFGPLGAATMIFQILTQSFFWASIFFASTAVFKTTKEYGDRFIMTAIFVAVLSFQNTHLSDFAMIIAGDNLLIATIIAMVVKVMLGIGACLVTKYYLDNKYILQ